jgi:threonine/homoserine/homoserine lactone efflux protein
VPLAPAELTSLRRTYSLAGNLVVGDCKLTRDLATVCTTLGLYAAAVVSPGPNFAFVSRLAIAAPKRVAFAACFGIALAATCYAILSMTGLALVIKKIAWLVSAVQIAGGSYLIYLGVTAWLSSVKGQHETSERRVNFGRGLRSGFFAQLSNPKAIAFFLSLYAVAVPSDTAPWAKAMILAGGFILELGWYSTVTTLLSQGPARAFYDKFARWIERALGTVLAGFGFGLIAEKL